MLTVMDILTSSGKYPDREKDPSCTEEVRDNAQILCVRVNALLDELGLTATVSSGFRTPLANAAIKTAAKKSNHMKGCAVDLVDVHGHICNVITPKLLEQCGLYMENPGSTPTWTHLQTTAPHSGNRIFIP